MISNWEKNTKYESVNAFLHTLQLQLHEDKSCQSHLVCQCQNLQIKKFIKSLCNTTFRKSALIYSE